MENFNSSYCKILILIITILIWFDIIFLNNFAIMIIFLIIVIVSLSWIFFLDINFCCSYYIYIVLFIAIFLLFTVTFHITFVTTFITSFDFFIIIMIIFVSSLSSTQYGFSPPFLQFYFFSRRVSRRLRRLCSFSRNLCSVSTRLCSVLTLQNLLVNTAYISL